MSKKKQQAKLLQTIESFFYKVRFNIALHTVLSSDEYDVFQKAVKKAIEKQILYFAKIEKVNSVIGVTKGVDTDMLAKVKSLFPPIAQFLDEAVITKYLTVVAKKGGSVIVRQLSDEEVLTLGKEITRLIDSQTEASFSTIDNTTQTWITKVIERGLNDGDNHYAIAKDLRNSAADIATYRSEVIAEQEAALLLGELTLDIFAKHDIQYKRLITSRDERVCPICTTDEAAGLLKLDEQFPSGAVGTPIHVGCRCFLEPL